MDTPSSHASPGARLPLEHLDLEPGQIESHFRWARRQGHPQYLWPALHPGMWRGGLREIERVTTAVLRGEGRPVHLDLPVRVRAGSSAPAGGSLTPARALGIAAFTSGLGPLLGHWIEAGVVTADAQATSLLRLHLDHGRRRWERLHGELDRVCECLGSVGATPIVLKGIHTAHYFPDPAVRPMADIDLLVDASRMEDAMNALVAAGYQGGPADRSLRPFKGEWTPPGSSAVLRSIELTHVDNPLTIDLHSSLDRRMFGIRTIPFDSERRTHLVETADESGPGPVLAQPLLTAFLAVHSAHGFHQLPMLRLVELVLVMGRDRAEKKLDWGALAALLDRIGATRFVYPPFLLAEKLVPGSVDPLLLSHLAASAPRGVRRLADRMSPSDAQRMRGVSIGERFMWAEGPREMLKRALDVVAPEWVFGDRVRLGRIHGERLMRILRGRVSLRADPPEL